MRRSIFGAVAATLILSSSGAGAAIISNGGFESGFLGWTVSSGTDPQYAPVVIQYGQASPYPTGASGELIPAAPSGGLSGAYFLSDFANQSISQSISLAAGTAYSVSFNIYSPINGTQNPFDALLQSVSGGSLSPVFQSKALGAGWTNYWGGFVAGGGPYSFSLNFGPLGSGPAQAAADFVVDNIDISVAVPEPATWAMMIMGFMGIGFLAYRRRATPTSFRLA